MSIAIAGASGNLGRRTADLLLARIDASELVLVTRDPAKLDDYASRGVHVRFGDFDQPDSLPNAFASVERLLLISASDLGRRVAQHLAAIRAATEAGVRHVAYTSIVNPSASTPIVAADDHRATEEALRASGLEWTFLRNSIYADFQAGSILGSADSGRFVHNQGDGLVAYVAREDCAAAAAAVLAGDGHAFEAYDITGPELLTADDTVRIASDAIGAPIESVAVDDASYMNILVEYAGLPADVAAAYATFGTGAREGYSAVLSNAVERLTGGPATPFAAVVAASIPVMA
ncbi:MAG TPA: SDR family oxidoreductase [Candidatus Limnocylindrales bacterium]|jgi:NAD(P)H dehydrogenase (quinone)|nr:SDR family oxidoreductase [Candidatus Limnocylindrales bacterium]